jgi:hypothetical protein
MERDFGDSATASETPKKSCWDKATVIPETH